MLMQLNHSPTIAAASVGTAVPVAQGVAMLKPPETGRSRKEQAVDEDEALPPVESPEQTKRAGLETPDAAETRLLHALKQRDMEVRAHEQAHAAVAGQHAIGGPVFDYQRGPNGRMYAVGGHVKLDTAPIAGDPQATLEKAETLRRAAMAPAQPSAQDRRVAAQAASMAMDARTEIRTEETRQADADKSALETETETEATTAPDAEQEPSATPEPGDRLDARLRATGALPAANDLPQGLNLKA